MTCIVGVVAGGKVLQAAEAHCMGIRPPWVIVST